MSDPGAIMLPGSYTLFEKKQRGGYSNLYRYPRAKLAHLVYCIPHASLICGVTLFRARLLHHYRHALCMKILN